MAIEKCENCGGIHFRNAPCPPALLARKSASAVKPAPRPRMTDRSGESRKDRAGQAKKSPSKGKEAAGTRPVPSVSVETAPGPVQPSLASNSAKPLGVTGGESATASSGKRKDTRKGDRHKPGYWSTYQRKDRMKP